MANFSVNQNRQFYVVKNFTDAITDASSAGDIAMKVIGDKLNQEVYFTIKEGDHVVRTDRIQVKNLDYVKKTEAADMLLPLKSYKVSLNAAYLKSSKPIPGQDYVLRIVFKQFYGLSDGHTYVKEGCVHVTTGMTAAQFYTALADSLNLNFSREVGATKESNPYLTFTAAADGVTITEKEQDWVLGTMKQRPLMFDIFPTSIYVDGVEVDSWGTVSDITPTTDLVAGTNAIGNGKRIADLEWFCKGERGDQYRYKGWPNYIPTHYDVDPTAEYDVLDLHFAFTDTGVNSYRSEKDITFVATQTDKAVITDLLEAIDEALDLGLDTSDAGSGSGN